MRTTILACILASGLLAVPLAALADDGPNDHANEAGLAHAQGKGRSGNHTNETDDDNATGKGRNHTARAAAHDAFLAALKAARASWMENASKVRETCHAAEAPEHGKNASRDARGAWAHCIRDA